MSTAVDGPVTPHARPDEALDAPTPRGHRRVARRVVGGVLVVLAVLVVAAGWLVYRGLQASEALLSARTVLSDLQTELEQGRTDQLESRLPQVQEDLATARRASSDPVWRAAEVLPLLGPNLTAVRVVSASLDDVTRDALPAVVMLNDALAAPEARSADGRLDLAPFVAAGPRIVVAADTARTAQAAVARIETDRLVGAVAGPVGQLTDGLDRVSGALDAGAQVATLLPPMLGADGPRTYLLVSLNSAELRSAGGIVGAFAVLRAEDGAVTLTDQRSTMDLGGIDASILPLTDEELVVDTDRIGRWVQDAVITPDFPRSAELLAARWERDMGQHVDGVIAADPVAVRYLLEATGPVTEPGGSTIGSEDVLRVLLSDSYLQIPDPAAVDAFYAGVAATIFRAVGSGQGDPHALVTALARAGSEGRLRLWSAHPQEQDTLVSTTLGAAFLTGDFPDATGVFLNDGTAGKLDYYLTTTVTVEDLRCTGEDPSATVRLDLDYRPPADVASLPAYVTGPARAGVPVGTLSTNVTVYAPVGAPLQSLGRGEGFVSGTTATAAGRRVQVVTSRLAPGATETYRVTVPVRDGAVSVWTTPTLTSPGFVTASCPNG
ncbi:DUF4012 domain-containing protein [Cellulomonas fengjieae]|uniref:DUF4012 domain-containing protein n=1 Tax=Cellulomonas fengjieae TaxID=2819978 RepID=A0ABS3SLM7_9CELL|nr:DUF4012 domain-containing protein [Cellulomonas fengjieae]MBO3086651.1 DUF4012 domain-containing protein [Cellulomonas fengjieae]QVI66501.1 DUF4012 domain-containing protein [Cellulomonas fengjieae]